MFIRICMTPLFPYTLTRLFTFLANQPPNRHCHAVIPVILKPYFPNLKQLQHGREQTTDSDE